MWRTTLLIPVLIAAAVAAAVTACRLAGVSPHGHEAAVAVGVAAAASAVAVAVLSLGKLQPPSPTGPAMSALMAMSTHLGVTLVLSILTLMTTSLDAAPFAYWMLGLFWASMAGVAAACVWVVRHPDPRTTG